LLRRWFVPTFAPLLLVQFAVSPGCSFGTAFSTEHHVVARADGAQRDGARSVRECGTATQFAPLAPGHSKRQGLAAWTPRSVTAIPPAVARDLAKAQRRGSRRSVHRFQARFSPVNFTEYPRFLMPANKRSCPAAVSCRPNLKTNVFAAG
jgi:hypothetical protein